MPIKIGHASIDEKNRISGGSAGDQSGKEVCTRAWYNGKWNIVLRPKSSTLAEKSAKACEAACANSKIGYDQVQRNTLYKYAKARNFDLAKIVEACECDCSSLMHVCAIAGGADLKYGVNGLCTFNMVDAFVKTGQYETLTASIYLSSDAYLRRGDILVRESGHTAMVLENGSQGDKTAVTTPSTTGGVKVSVSLNTLRKGNVGAEVESLQILLNGRGYSCGNPDGDFGPRTFEAVKKFQKAKGLTQDGVVGAQTWPRLLRG